MNLSPDQLSAIKREAFIDPVLFCETFLEDWYRGEIAWFQRGLLAVLTRQVDFLEKYGEVDRIIEHFTYATDPARRNSPRACMFRYDVDGKLELVVGRFTQLRIPRGFSKTTIVNTAILRAILYGLHRVVVNTSETATHASTQLKNIRHQFETNNKIRAIFGDLVPEQRSGFKWTEDQLDCTNGVTLVAKGRGQQIRGLLFRGYRPSMIILDDVEDRDEVKNPLLRKDTLEWAYNDVMPALDDIAPGNTLIAIGTLLHPEALLKSFEMDTRFTTIIFSAKLPSGEMLWPKKFSAAAYADRKLVYARMGLLASFYLEYDNSTRVVEGALFPIAKLNYGEPGDDEEVYKAISLDPAISKNAKATQPAIAVVGISSKGRWYIFELELFRRGTGPSELIDAYFEFWKKYRPQYAGVESIAYQAALIHIMKEQMFRRKAYFEITGITHKIRKEERLEGVVSPRVKAGTVWLTRPFPELIAQFSEYPNGLVDGIDAVEMAMTLLDPQAAQAADPDGDLGDDEYEPLESDLLASAV